MFTLGVDFGTNSVRALVVRVSDGAEFGSRVVDYPSGAQGVLLDPKDDLLARQHPGDYLFGLETSIRAALAAGVRQAVISTQPKWSASASTPPVRARFPSTRHNRPLALDRAMEDQSLGAVLALEGSYQLARGRQDHRTRREASPAIHRQVRRHLFLRVVLVQDLALPERRAQDFRRRLFLGRAGRLGSVRARRRHRSAAGQARRLRRRPQGALLRRVGRSAGQGIPDRARSRARRPARPALREGLRRDRAGGIAVPRMGGEARPCRRHSDRHRRVRRALRRDRLRRQRGHAGQGDRHLDLRLRRGVRRQAASPTFPASAAS